MKVLNITLSKDSKIKDLKKIVSDLIGGDSDASNMVIANVDIKTRIIETKFKNDQSC